MVGMRGRSGGRNKKSANLRLIEGNRGHRPIPAEPKADGFPVTPGYFNAEQKALWREIVESAPKNILKKADSLALENLVIAVVRLRKAESQLAREDLVVAGASAMVKNPLISIIRGTEQTVIALTDRLGLTPSARLRISVGKEEDDNDMDWLMGS